MPGPLPVLSAAAIEREIERGGRLALLVSKRSVAGCHVMAATLESVAAEYAGRVTVGILDLQRDQAVADRWLARAAPSLLFFVGGALVDRVDGVVSRGQVTRRLDLMLSARPPG
ncbi:MAG: thioredoxin family protein [Gemmatimonadales bacterium]